MPYCHAQIPYVFAMQDALLLLKPSEGAGLKRFDLELTGFRGCLMLRHVDLGGGFKYCLFSRLFVEMIQFDEHIFQMGWFNHQLEMISSFEVGLSSNGFWSN